MSKGGYWTKHLLVIATAGLALHLPAAVSAADCEHCVEDEIECQQIYYPDNPGHTCEDPYELLTAHAFPIGNYNCNDEGGGGTFGGLNCRACGNNSRCHHWWEEGECHEECAHHLAAIVELSKAIEERAAARVASLILAHESFVFSSDAGAIQLVGGAACGRTSLQMKVGLSLGHVANGAIVLEPAFASEVATAAATD